jgi:hypothetical protein
VTGAATRAVQIEERRNDDHDPVSALYYLLFAFCYKPLAGFINS